MAASPRAAPVWAAPVWAAPVWAAPVRAVLVHAALAAGLLAAPQARADVITMTLGAPGQTLPGFAAGAGGSGLCAAGAGCSWGTETFSGLAGAAPGTFTSSFATGANTFGPGQSITGTYTGALTRSAANVYGGAGGADYPVVFGTGSYHLALATTGLPGVNLLGFWLSALDYGNLLTFSTASGTTTNLSAATLLQDINATATPAAYYGNPTAPFRGQDSGEAFAYVELQDTTGFFTGVDFINHANTGFESSNHAAGYAAPASLQVVAQVPEPASIGLMGIALLGVGLVRLRCRNSPPSSKRPNLFWTAGQATPPAQ